MREEFDMTDAYKRSLPPSDRVGVSFRGMGFSIRRASLTASRLREKGPRTDRREEQDSRPKRACLEANSPTDDNRLRRGLSNLRRIASVLRQVLADQSTPGVPLPPAHTPRQRSALPLPAATSPARPQVPRCRPPTRSQMAPSELALERVRASIRALRSSRDHAGNWVIVLTPEMGDGPVPPDWVSELNCLRFTVFDVGMLNDLVISAGSSIACIMLDGRHHDRALAEQAILEAKRRHPPIRSVLLDTVSRCREDIAACDGPFDVRLGLPLTQARLKWAIVAGEVVAD